MYLDETDVNFVQKTLFCGIMYTHVGEKREKIVFFVFIKQKKAIERKISLKLKIKLKSKTQKQV
jgi:hypothetical protein